jgi:hypothetical protein
MNKERRREVLEHFCADKLIVYEYQNNGALTNVDCLVPRTYARELNKEIISYCEKHRRYAG